MSVRSGSGEDVDEQAAGQLDDGVESVGRRLGVAVGVAGRAAGAEVAESAPSPSRPLAAGALLRCWSAVVETSSESRFTSRASSARRSSSPRLGEQPGGLGRVGHDLRGDAGGRGLQADLDAAELGGLSAILACVMPRSCGDAAAASRRRRARGAAARRAAERSARRPARRRPGAAAGFTEVGAAGAAGAGASAAAAAAGLACAVAVVAAGVGCGGRLAAACGGLLGRGRRAARPRAEPGPAAGRLRPPAPGVGGHVGLRRGGRLRRARRRAAAGVCAGRSRACGGRRR